MFESGKSIGPYTLVKRLGRGGFGEVWLAERRTQLLTTKVAVKLPLAQQVDLEAVKGEAVLWEQASGHPNVLPIIEANIYGGQVIIVSEFAPGGSLADHLSQQGRLLAADAVEMTCGILDGLEYLHSRKIIHRDLKPANVLLQGKTPRLADFGISRILQSTSMDYSLNMAGTPPYMAPEAFDGKRNVQTDIWSAGVMLYQLLTGCLPFPQQDLVSLIKAVRAGRPGPLPDAVSKPVKDILDQALRVDTARRYKSAARLRDELRSADTAPMGQESTIRIPEMIFTEISPDEWGYRPRNKAFNFLRSIFREK